MTLKPFQTAIALNKLYRVSLDYNSASDQIKPSLFVNSGNVNVYGYNGATKPTQLSGMVLPTINQNINTLFTFNMIPSYIAITQNSGTTTELVLSGLEIQDLGAIS